ncbi:haloacid dehalogenase [Tepiditoga spiralis]|uniref:Haloacid dehalogenase n=1 Tax=Tepiditoga spiralis TaxID=2108365 RepID=A0A7G1G238_9BACT|nr:HAD family hydrolase [Tepiditoga spiralis]BBE29915.1 haloacid dehalogenase [Tepiditoga spiralis]
MKSFVFDLDGTLLNSNIEITQNTINSLKKLKEQGTSIIIATGRMYSSMMYIIEKYLPFLKGYSPLIAYNGAYVLDKNKNILYESTIENKIACKCIKFLRNENIHRQAYINDVLIVEEDNNEIKSYSKHASIKYVVVKDLIDEINKRNNVIKLLAIGKENIILELQKKLKKNFEKDLNIIQSFKTYLDLVHKNTSKGAALKKVFEYYNLSFDNTYIFGDSQNDISMLNLTKNSFVLNNASNEVKKHAKYVIPSNDEDGVSFAIEKILSSNSFTYSN